MSLSTLAPPSLASDRIFTGKSVSYTDTDKNRYWSIPHRHLIELRDQLLWLKEECREDRSPTIFENRYHNLVIEAYDNIIGDVQRIFCLREEQELFQVIQDHRALAVILSTYHRATGAGTSTSPNHLDQSDFRIHFRLRTSRFSLLGLPNKLQAHIQSYFSFKYPPNRTLLRGLRSETLSAFRNRHCSDTPIKAKCPYDMREEPIAEDPDFSSSESSLDLPLPDLDSEATESDIDQSEGEESDSDQSDLELCECGDCDRCARDMGFANVKAYRLHQRYLDQQAYLKSREGKDD